MKGGQHWDLCFHMPVCGPLWDVDQKWDPGLQGTHPFGSARFSRATPSAAGARGPVSSFCASSQIVPDAAACTLPVSHLCSCGLAVRRASLDVHGVTAAVPSPGAVGLSVCPHAFPLSLGLYTEGSVSMPAVGCGLPCFWRPWAPLGPSPLLPSSVVKGSAHVLGPGWPGMTSLLSALST